MKNLQIWPEHPLPCHCIERILSTDNQVSYIMKPSDNCTAHSLLHRKKDIHVHVIGYCIPGKYMLSPLHLMSMLFYAKNDTLQLHVTCEQKSHHFFMYWIYLNYWQIIEYPIPQKLWNNCEVLRTLHQTKDVHLKLKMMHTASAKCIDVPKEYTLIELFTPHDIVSVWWPRKHHHRHWYSCWPNPPPRSTAAWDGRAAISKS